MSRHQFKQVEGILLDNILLDTGNPRIRTGAGQQDCIDKVMRKQSQMLTLMKSIAENGLGTMPILLYRAPKKRSEWIVKDGNRRITALKLLNSPALCSDQTLRAQIESIRKKHKRNIPGTVDCLESTNLDVIAREVLSRHGGAQDGAGQLDWNAYLRTVFQLNSGFSADYKRPGQYLFWAEKNGIMVDDEFPITNVARFFNEANLSRLGFDVHDDQLVPNLNPELVRKMAIKIITDFGVNKKNVSEVFQEYQAAAYIQEVRAAAGLDNEVSPKEPEPTPKDQRDKNPHPGEPGEKNPNKDPSQPKGGRPPTKPAWDRNKLFWRVSPAPSVPASEQKTRQILFEIGKIPKTSDMPVTCAMLLRALVELSVARYLNQHSMRDRNKLATNMSAVADSMLNRSVIDQSLTDLVKAYAITDKTQVSIFNIDTIQKYIHRDTHLPSYSTLHTVWDEIGPFVRACWAH